ncbi:Cystathionine beta-lyase [Candidatus Ornithobacterium hominis]|uniref:PLP-dependent transferase n=1 Tax=Candidatus Ornithobacterium hominis TaxID=2497989 RepID=UPI000E5C1A62|nr:PLP-dependent transferase [Candidatus Ornithobacterium hominis]SZD71818.1 Cystathionine beta-lyase [Candidatus Ornithobacterium hominis]
MNYFPLIPTGEFIPQDNPHAVSVSLPFFQDIIDYEEEKPALLQQMRSGYPRFFVNGFVKQIILKFREENVISPEFEIFVLPNERILKIIENKILQPLDYSEKWGLFFVKINKKDEIFKALKKIIRNIGAIVSSRRAEDILCDKNWIRNRFEEEIITENAPNKIKNSLAKAYGCKPSDVLLANSGTNAVFAAIETILRLQNKSKNGKIVQLGWLYLDSQEIIQSYDSECYVQLNVHDKNALENYLENNYQNLSCVVTEVITNPSLQCVDLPWLRELCLKYHLPLIVDSTLGTPYLVDVLPYCDVAVESLTKFASGNADVLMGAVIVNPSFERGKAFLQTSEDFLILPYQRDVERLAFEISGYENRVKQAAENAHQLYEFLKKQDFTAKIYAVQEGKSRENYKKIAKTSIPGVPLLGLVFEGNIRAYYDMLPFAKGPSLGTEFTLAMAYVYLAHYDLLQTEAGIDYLEKNDLNPNLLRISVGVEPIEEILKAFKNL